MSNQYIEVSKLVKSPLNVRKTDSKAACEELKASILAHGLMQNLVVMPGKNDRYEVVAGARRLAALKSLVEDGNLPIDHAVPCQVVTEERAYEMSLAENTVRAAMHPADEHAAYAVLASSGSSVEEIAQRFGKSTRHVEQRMKLGRAAPELIQLYREGKLKLEMLEAFTITDDKKRQWKVYNQIKSGWQIHHPREVRGLLTEKMVDGKSKFAAFVGLDAYQKAGGAIRRDLFGDDVFLENPELLRSLADEKLRLAAEALKAEGWSWVEVAAERDWQFANGCQELEPEPLDAPQELLDEKARIEAELETVEKQWGEMDSEDEAFDALDQKKDKLENRIWSLNQEIEGYGVFTPEQMATAGCYVTIGGDGDLSVEMGLVKPEDVKIAAKASPDVADDEDDGEDDQPADKPKGMPESLKRDVEAYRLGVAQVEIASHPAIAFDLLVFKVAKNALTMRSPYDGPDVSFSRNFAGAASAEAREFLTSQMQAVSKTLPVGWLKHDSEAEQFLAFREMLEAQKHALLAYCVGLTLKPKLAPAEGNAPTAYDISLSQTGANVADYWRPARASYLSRITKDQLLTLGEELLGPDWARHRRDSKKGQLVDQLHEAFDEPEKHGKTPEQVTSLKNWLPAGMEFGVLPEPGTAKAKKGNKAA